MGRRLGRGTFVAAAGAFATLAVFVSIRLIGSAMATSGGDPYSVPLVVDTNADPNIVETTIVAAETVVDIGNGVFARAQTFNGQIPGPMFKLKVGDTVIVHFYNQLSTPTGIHWHGIELANASDGTPLTQNQVPPGGSFLYKFKIRRPGIFWYHPHHHSSTNQVFKGLYGPIVVTDPYEFPLQSDGTLPPSSQTLTLALSDVTVCKAPGSNDALTYDGTTQPHVALANPWGPQSSPNPVNLCETTPINEDGSPRGAFAAGDIPNIQPAGTAARVNEGQTVLTNGKNVGGRSGNPSSPGALAANAATFDVFAGQGLRLQIANTATIRFFRLRLTDNSGAQVPLVRVGGEGGLLDNAVLEGGVVSGFDFKYSSGEILLDPGSRADVVAAIPLRATGVLTLWTEDFSRTGQGFALTPTVPVAHFRVNGMAASLYTISAGTPLRSSFGVAASVETLPPPANVLLNPALFVLPKPGMASQEIQLTQTGSALGINGVLGSHECPGDYTTCPNAASTRYAKLGDTLELTVKNLTAAANHPFHLHGFSIQPLDLTKPSAPTYTWPYREFRDNIDIPPQYTLRFRMRVEDRPLMDGVTAGGAYGRWVFHCHIFFHAIFGMISEFDVVSPYGKRRPYVFADQAFVEFDPAGTATVTGTYSDPDGDPVTLAGPEIGLFTDHGDGTWSWSYSSTGGSGTGEPPPLYVTATDSDGLQAQTAFAITAFCANPTRPDGTPCDDGNACTIGDQCAAGHCAGSLPTSPTLTKDLVAAKNDLGSTSLSWGAVSGASAYDIVDGGLSTLRSSTGGFQSATEGCLAQSAAGTSFNMSATPAVGDGLWILVRARNCVGVGSYDDATAAASRDAGIAASTHDCP